MNDLHKTALGSWEVYKGHNGSITLCGQYLDPKKQLPA